VAANGCGQKAGAEAAKAGAAKTAGALQRVTVAAPMRETLELATTQPAWIESFQETPLFSKLAGYVKQVHVDIGDRVANGQPLVTLDIPELADEVAQKEALVSQAVAELSQAECNIAAEEAAAESATARIAEARAGVGRTNGEFERSTAEYERIKNLADSGSVSDKLVDESRNQLRSAEAACDEAKAALTSAEAAAKEAAAKAHKAHADRAAAEARMRVTQADLARARTMLAYTEIKAPYDGAVTERWVETGYFVQPASSAISKPLLTVARTDKVRVFLDVPELEAALVDTGDKVTLRVQALAGKELPATVARTSWSLNKANRSLRVEADIDNEKAILRPGMYATATVVLQRRENVLTLPIMAIVRAADRTYCCRVESNKIIRQPLQLGLRSNQKVEVLSGVDEKALVVQARAEGLSDGQPVEAVPSQKPSP
jgi:RND family efflux transporter MFP subunit